MSRSESSRARSVARTIVAALPLLWTLNAWPQSSARPVGVGYRIAGRVVNSSTGEPVARAMVTALTQQGNQTAGVARSDADGNFVIENLPAGKYPLTASKRGFRTAFYDEHENFNSAIVTGEGQDTEHLQFGLAPAAIIHGLVTGDGGDPIDGANVMLFRLPTASPASERAIQVDGTVTDDTGAYEFGNLSAGEYYVAVKAEPWYALRGRGSRSSDSPDRTLDVAYPITFFDSTIEEASAAPIALAEGSREQANIYLHAVPALHLRLHGTPARHGQRPVELRETVFGNQIQSRGMLVVQRGEMETDGVAPGHYELTHGDPPRTVELDATADLDVDASAGTPAVSVTGTLRSTSGSVIAEDANVLLESDGTRRGHLQTFARKGQFQFDNVLPGRWSLSAFAGADGQALPVISISNGAHVSSGNEIAVADQAVTIGVAVSRAQAMVQGFARMNGKPASGVMIVLVPRAPGGYPALARRDQSDSDGSFSLRDVAPGQYTVIAIEDGWKLDWQRHDAIERFIVGGVAVTIGERPDAVVQLARPVPAVPR